MEDNLTDQQRAERVREWFTESGWSLLAGLVLGLAALFGWRQWTGYSESQAEKASALYEELLTAVRVERTVRAEEIAAELAAGFKGTPYLDQARLVMARMKVDKSRPEEAAKYLELVVRDASSDVMEHIARLRLGRVLIQQEKYDEALKVLALPKGSAFLPRYQEVRGDAYFALGRMEEARSAYEAALEGAGDGTVDPAYLGARLDEVRGLIAAGGAADAAGVPAAAAQ